MHAFPCSACRLFTCVLNHRWEDLDDYALSIGRKVTPTCGDGFCLFNSIRSAFMHDYGILYSIKRIKEEVMNQLLNNISRYSAFHLGSLTSLVEEVEQFFKSGRYQTDVVDLMVPVCADALRVNLCVYKKHANGKIHRVVHAGDGANRNIHVRFSTGATKENPNYLGGNHYESMPLFFGPAVVEVLDSGGPPTHSYTEEEDADDVIIPQVDDVIIIDDEAEGGKQPANRNNDVIYIDSDDDDLETLEQQFMDVKAAFSRVKVPNDDRSSMLQIDDATLQQYLVPRTRFPEHLFHGILPQTIDHCPDDIDGNQYYRIECSPASFIECTDDRRHWHMVTSTDRVDKSKRKVGFCNGCYECTNPLCSFKGTADTANESLFQNMGIAGHKICYSCHTPVRRKPCNARKLICFKNDEAHVFHIGKHTCTLKIDNKEGQRFCADLIKKYPNQSTKKLRHMAIQSKWESGDWAGAREAANLITYENIRQARIHGDIPQPETTRYYMQSIDAVAEVKKATDKADPCYIFKLHKNTIDKARPDLVFKASFKLGEIGALMDQNGRKNPLQDVDVFFDGCHSRVDGFVALALWVYHPAMRRLLRLASMEVKSEKAEHIKLFWQFYDEVLRMYTGDPTFSFNPRKIMCDASGAVANGIADYFGHDFYKRKILGCQWHFLNNAEHRAQRIGEAHRETFLQGCMNLTRHKTIPAYNAQMRILRRIASMYDASVLRFLEWWDVRKYHMFGPFRQHAFARMNLAETGNAAWKPDETLTLVQAAKDDTTSMLAQEEDFAQFKAGLKKPTGKGPSDRDRARKEERHQIEQGKAFAELFTVKGALQIQEDGELEMGGDDFMPYKDGSCRQKDKKAGKGLEGTAGRGKRGRGRGRGRGTTTTTATTTGRGRGRGRGKGKLEKEARTKRASQPLPSLESMLATLSRAEDVQRSPPELSEEDEENVRPLRLGRGNVPRHVRPVKPTKKDPNPPTITKVTRQIHVCQGCKGAIKSADMKHPHNLVFCLQMVRPYPNRDKTYWIDELGKGYMHLSPQCLHDHNPDAKIEDVTMDPAEFEDLSAEQFSVLQKLQLLQPLTENMRKIIGELHDDTDDE